MINSHYKLCMHCPVQSYSPYNNMALKQQGVLVFFTTALFVIDGETY